MSNFLENSVTDSATESVLTPEPAGADWAPSSKASVVLGAMPLLGTLTGIGQYVRQLAIALKNERGIL